MTSMAKRTSKQKSNSKNLLPCGRPRPVVEEDARSTKELLNKLKLQLNVYCTEQKLNRSEAREKILETVIKGARHFTALELLERLQRRFPEIGKATMYRNIPVLVDSGILQEGPHDSKGHILYELSEDDHHDHIVCLDCRQIFEFHDEKLEKRQDQISETLHFTPKSHRHMVYAVCNYLRRNS